MKSTPLFWHAAKRFTSLAIIATLTISGCGGGGNGGNSGTTSSSKIEKLTVTTQADGTRYFTGTYNGTVVRFTHKGAIGQGYWSVYSGPPGNRTRVTISDTRGVQEVLAMDKGHRTTINYVGTERIEYRTYASNGQFVLGSVLYLMGDRWQQGLMFTEAFKGYASLVSVTDVTAEITRANADLNMLMAKAAKPGLLRNFAFIGTAEASWNDLREYGGTVWDIAKTVGWNGLATMTGIAVATLGAAETGALITTVGGAVVAGAAATLTVAIALAPLATAITAGYLIGSWLSNNANQPQISEETVAPATEEDYLATTAPTPYSTIPPPSAPPSAASGPTITPTPISPATIAATDPTAPPPAATPTCTSSQVLQGGVCVESVPTCVFPMELVNNVCVRAVPTCTTNQVLHNGECVSTCPANQVTVNGACVSQVTIPGTGTGTVTPICTAPNVIQNGVCVAPAPSAAPLACQVTSWSAWSACSAQCGGGTQTSSRAISVQPANGGTACPELTRTQACNTQACIIGVNGTWNYTTTNTYTNSMCTNLNAGPQSASMTLTEVGGVVRNSTGTRTGTRTGNTIAITWTTAYGSRSESWNWNGGNTITGIMAGMCANPTTNAIIEEIRKPFTATRN
jgi:hypothetical protein